MPVKTVILDRDGTLYNDATGQLQPGVPEMLRDLGDLGVQVFVVSNEQHNRHIQNLIGLPRDRFFNHDQCGIKGSKKYVEAVMAATGHSESEIVYVGDSDLDMREASNKLIPYFNAVWSHGNYRYGVQVATPQSFSNHVKDFFLKEHPWWFKVDDTDQLGRSITFRALLDPNHAINTGIRNLIKGWALDRTTTFGAEPYKLGYFLGMHLFGSLFTSGMHLLRVPGKLPIFCIYPGHEGAVSGVLENFLTFSAKQFRAQYLPGLLVRHENAESSRERKLAGKEKLFSTQMNTVSVDQTLARKVRDNLVFVVDDVTSDAHSMETSRNLLYACGAKQVVGLVAVKYIHSYSPQTPKPGVTISSRGGPPSGPYVEANFREGVARYTMDDEALKQFE